MNGVAQQLADWILEGRAPELVRALAADPGLIREQVRIPGTAPCSVIQACINYQRVEILRAAVRLGFDINSAAFRHDSTAVSMLIYAIITSKPNVVRFAIANGAKLDQVSKRGRTPLAESLQIMATIPGELDEQILDILLAAKAPWGVANDPEGSPFNDIIRATWIGRADEMAALMHKIARAGFPLLTPSASGEGLSPNSPVEVAIHSGNRRALSVVAQIAHARFESDEGRAIIERLHITERESWVPEITGVMMTISDDPNDPLAQEVLRQKK